ncbi:Anthranilate phosphoribosyltransferase [Dissostichus eleginoides]|uniref:Anthranilate phosphoribosyltransferase n=1 Tax=Dissostichus eleginoides TaxID=100907 RepID=A0AAD9B519_DISEL|nr:Anthranilate phosphoribosyltransferase [Dissostichus eleginoides]
MMKISGRVTWCCVALLLALTSVSAVQKKLKSINDLKKINFGQSVPKHSLLLLHWFANTVNIDENNVISLAFDPNDGDYGSHYYGNFEELLDPLPRPRGNQYHYYTIGNLRKETSNPLPSYVARPRRAFAGENRDRIIVLVREQNTGWQTSWRIDHVYITQHFQYQGEYDPDHTYRITTNLLREIREFSVGEDQQPLSYLRNRFGSSADDFDIENTWGHLACLGLLLYIVLGERHPFTPQSNYTPQVTQQSAYTPDNRQTSWCEAFEKCCMIVVVLLICLFIFAISAARR